MKTKRIKYLEDYPLNWDNKGENKFDNKNQTFLFSLNLKKKYDMIDNKKGAIYGNEGNGPYLGGLSARDFSIEKNIKKG